MKFMTAVMCTLVMSSLSCAQVQKSKDSQSKNSNESSSWTFTRGAGSGTRGGTTVGVPVKRDMRVSSAWKKLQNPNLSGYEKDRMAILALQGEFKTTFEFLETILMDTTRKFDVPYNSWGTEVVKLVEEREGFISLQHIMVMSFKDPKTGDVQGPFVMKHWRQDWEWQPAKELVFVGDNTWTQKKIRRRQSEGKWKWTVYQVDDTPRYSAIGEWNHLKSASLFETKIFTRPLPRREFSVRSDYKLLLGTDTLILNSNAWYHEQRNFKHKNSLERDLSVATSPLLAREIGHNSYLRIQDYDFSLGDDYWSKSNPYWADVRWYWEQYLSKNKKYSLKSKHDGKFLFQYHFANAEDDKILALSVKERRAVVKELIEKFLN